MFTLRITHILLAAPFAQVQLQRPDLGPTWYCLSPAKAPHKLLRPNLSSYALTNALYVYGLRGGAT
jgi:hypothetical protein